jgi:heptosyltransferase-3
MPESVLNLAGRLNFAEVAELLKQAKLYVGPDTAVTHLAAAVGTPTLAIYGPTNPLKWSPWPQGWAEDANPFARQALFQRNGKVVLLQGEGVCVPCHEEGCDRHKDSASRCLDTLAAARVIDAARRLLDG